MIGKANKTAIGTLVERSTGYALLVHLPDGYKPEQVAARTGGQDQHPARHAAPLADLGPRP